MDNWTDILDNFDGPARVLAAILNLAAALLRRMRPHKPRDRRADQIDADR